MLLLDGSPGSVPLARRALKDWLLDRGVTAATVERARLVVTELVDNAVVHTESAIRVLARANGVGVRIEVTDGAEGLPEASQPDPDSLSGRGLWLVSELADDWGAEERTPGKVVWAVVHW